MNGGSYLGDGILKTFKTGTIIDLMNPQPEQIFIEDIAHNLSLICRFNGQLCSFYSVAEHSVKVAEGVPRDWRLEGLLHDAAEAYIQDIIRPMKYLPIFAEYRKLEAIWEQAVIERFHLQYPFDKTIKQSDHEVQEWERQNIKWSCSYKGMHHEVAERYFMSAFVTFSVQRNMYETFKEEGSYARLYQAEYSGR